jgi:hypothetical protein
MEAQELTIDQPFHGAYEKFVEITTHLRAKSKGDETHSDIEAYLATDGRELLRLGAALLLRHLQPWYLSLIVPPILSSAFSSRNELQSGSSRGHL